MTVTIARLGRRQVDVLRAAADGNLVRFDDGGWGVPSGSCTPAARRVAALQPALLADGLRMAVVTLGSGATRHGTWMDLTTAGELVLAEWDRQHPEQVVQRTRRAELVAALAAKRGPITDADLRMLAAKDPTCDDDTYGLLLDIT